MPSEGGGGDAAAALGSLYRQQPLSPLPEYLPQDNDEAGTGAFHDGSGVLRLQAQALKALLALRSPAVFLRCVFIHVYEPPEPIDFRHSNPIYIPPPTPPHPTPPHSHVLHNPAVRRFLDSYLRYATRPHEDRLRAATAASAAALDPASEALRRALSRLVLLVHLRLCTDAGTVDALGHAGKGQKKAEELLQGALDVPRVLDLASLYGFTEPALLSRCLQAACRLRPSLGKAELPAALSATHATVIAEVMRVLQAAVEEEKAEEGELLDDRLEYLADVTAALSRLALAVPDHAAPAFADSGGQGPALLKGLRGAYGRLVQLEAAPDAGMAAAAAGGAPGAVEAVLARGRRRRAAARFARKCILALLNAVVAGVVAGAVQAGRRGAGRARAAEWLFSLVAGLLDSDAELAGSEAAAAAVEGVVGVVGPEEGRLIQDCIYQRHGGLRERVRRLLQQGQDGEGGEDDEAAGSIRYLLQLLDAAAAAGREAAEALRQRRAGESHDGSGICICPYAS